MSATFSGINGIYAMSADNLYLGDSPNYQLRWKGNGNGYSISPALPVGMFFDRTTGKISGTPTGAKTLTNYMVTAYNAAGSTSKLISFAVGTASTAPVSTEQNYIITRTARKAGFTGSVSLEGRPVEEVNMRAQYFDGLGREIQDVQWQGSPLKNDIVQHLEYDGLGRESIKYLPHVKNSSKDGSYKSSAKADQLAYYAAANTWDPTVAKTDYPYAVTVFESSPLNRMLQQGAAGAAWQPPLDRDLVAAATGTGRTAVTEYGTNGASDVKLWAVDAAGNGAKATFYAVGKLYKTTTKDENWVKASGKAGTAEEFKDFEDRVVLKRIWETDAKKLETYYIYDDIGDLRYVVPPAVTVSSFTELPIDPNFEKYVYAYRYDGRRRVIEKKIPGKGWDHLVYNKIDQLIQEQDAELRKTNKWVITKYDAFGRIVMKGIHQGSNPRQVEQDYMNNHETVLWEQRSTGQATYGNVSYPQNNFTVHLINYYDDYTFADAALLPAKSIIASTKTRSLPTGSLVYKDNGTAPLLIVNYYDDYGRLIQTASQNHLGGTDYVTNTYSFPGDLLTSTRVHTPKTGTATTIVTTNDYDHVGRLISTREKIGAQAEVTLASNSYNEIGQLKTKYMGKLATEPGYVDTTSYTYNERGWTKRIASTNYTQSLMYQDGGTVRQYNGNIAQQAWRFTPGGTTSTFEYGYDKLSRLMSGVNGQTGTASIAEVMGYDDMGNIRTLKRDALTVTTYAYDGNKLIGLTGGLSGSYTYYDNGNTKTDRMGMAFTYNYLNLPQTAIKVGTNVAFLYDASGTKLQKLSKIGTTTVVTTTRDYVDGIEYNNGVIDIIQNSGGYALKSGTGYVYHYNLTDHLGNVRTTLKRGASATAVDVVQRDNYYPFGKRKVVAGGNNKYLYNGKEIQGELGDQYDYGARFYDAEIGRWNVVDPLAADYYSTTPYTYVENNPIGYIDPTGMYKVDANGNITIDGRGEIENFVKFLNSNQGATYKDVATEVFSAGRGYSNELEEVAVTGSRSAFDNGSWLGSAQSRQASGATLIMTAFSLEGLSGGGALGLGISGSALTATGIGAALVGLTYIGFKMNEAGYPVDNRPFAQSALGLPSLSETNGFVFSKGGHRNIWPDQYGYPPNVKDVDWGKSDGQLADDLSNAHGDTKRGGGTPNNLARKWFRDKRPK